MRMRAMTTAYCVFSSARNSALEYPDKRQRGGSSLLHHIEIDEKAFVAQIGFASAKTLSLKKR
jgi:hypothetical protein